MKPTKILDTPTWWELAHQWYDWVYYSEAWKFMPITDAIVQWAQNAQDEARMSDNAADWANNVMDWLTAVAMYPVWVLTDAIWNVWTTAVNWYKKLYNAWADLSNRAKLKLIDKAIKDFQKKNPNKSALPVWKKIEYKSAAEKVKDAWAATDAEVWEATHEFWYWNDPRTVYRRLRYRKQQVNPKPRITL